MPADQPVRIVTPLGADELLFRSLTTRENLARPYLMDLELVSQHEDLEFNDLLGEGVTVELEQPEGGQRYFHGLVSEFSQAGRRGDLAAYAMKLRPRFWFLSRTADCRIFQEKTVPEILKDILRENGVSDFEEVLSGTYRTWEYLVQYRETDFNFLSRLMEQEGIYYYFRHEKTRHVMVLTDSLSGHDSIPDYKTIPYFPASENAIREEHIFAWSQRRKVSSGNYALGAYDFRKPSANIEGTATISQQHAIGKEELYDYPGEHYERAEGETYAQIRMEEAQSEFDRCNASTDVRGIFPGGLFNLKGHPRSDQNKEYLITESNTSARIGDYESGGNEDFQFSCSFEVMDSQLPYRARRMTRKPHVQGPQTAIVVGPSGEEIHTDEYGRVKVQFHWDRYGKSDENSSCWVRVAQVWAGAKWGAMYIPRIGQEVIVDFVEGDPDRPIITGRVYNNEQMPPYDLPANKTRSTLKSRSSMNGTADNFNEIRFEDKKGSEELYFHAEKDQTIIVENDKNENVGHDNTETIGNDEKIDVGNNRDKTVGVDQSESIGSNKTITVGSNHSETIGSNKSINVGGSHTEMIGSTMAQTVGSSSAETVAAGKALTIGGGYQVSVGGAKNQTIGGKKSEQVGGDLSEDVGGDKSVDIAKSTTIKTGEDLGIDVGKKGAIVVADELSITVGKASIVLKKSGDITINGKKINLKGSGNIVMKASKILQN